MSGQQEPKWPADKPLALTINHFGPRSERHYPQGTLAPKSVPEGTEIPRLFRKVEMPVTKGLVLKNAIVVSPMCQYSCVDGFLTPYHLAHLGSFALHGAGTIMVEASGVTAAGRITPEDTGIWKDEHIPGHTSLVSALRSFAAHLTVGVQLAHAGRKASTWSPFYEGERKEEEVVTDAEGGWSKDVVGPSALSYGKGYLTARELTTAEVKDIQQKFVDGARRAFEAGYDFVELHAAHGYLLHSFLSPISNHRTDEYGGSFENRTRLLVETAREIRSKYPNRSVWVRVSGSDFGEHLGEGKSWTIEDTAKLAHSLHDAGVDVLDISGGGLFDGQRIKPTPAYQLPFAKRVSHEKLSHPLVATVGRMESGEHAGQLANQALIDSDAALVLLARGFLTRPSWVEDAAELLLGTVTAHNPQYHRALPVREVTRSKRDQPSL